MSKKLLLLFQEYKENMNIQRGQLDIRKELNETKTLTEWDEGETGHFLINSSMT